MNRLRILIPLLAVTVGFTHSVSAATADERRVTFLRDVMPIPEQRGLHRGACHGSAKGKNGFKPLLRGYDAEFDYRALLFEVSGRRFAGPCPKRA